MANNTNLVLQLLITAKDQASGILGDIKTKVAAIAASIAGAFSIKEAATFEQALDAIRARSDETGPALDALIEKAKETAQTLGPQFGYSATQAAGGIKELIAAGFSGAEAVDALKGTLALAAMEGIEVSQAAVLMSDAIAQFGLKASDASAVADILAKAAGAVAATAVDMGEALKYSGSAASQAGLSLTQTAAVLDVLGKAGQRGSEAGTGLASVLSILANPAHTATQALFDLGATSTELGDVLDFIQKQGLGAADIIGKFGEQGGRVINTLLAQGGTKAVQDFADQISATGKTAEQTAQVMQDNLIGAFNRFWESLKRVGIELATPNLERYAAGFDALTAGLNTFASNEKIKQFQTTLHDGFAAIGRVLLDVSAGVTTFLGAVNWEDLSKTAGQAFDNIRESAGRLLQSLNEIITGFSGSVPNAAGLAETASNALKIVWEGLAGAAQLVADSADRVAARLAEATNTLAGNRAVVVENAAASDQLTSALGRQADAAQQAEAAAKTQTSGYRLLLESLKNLAGQAVPPVFESMADAVGTLLAGIRDLGSALSAWTSGLIDNVSPSLSLVADLVKGLATAVVDLARVFTPSMEGMADSGKAMGAVLTTAFAGIVGMVSAISAGILKLTETVLTGWVEIGKLANVISDADAAALEARILKIGDAASNMAGLSAKAFETAGAAQEKFKAAIEGVDASIKAAATTSAALAAAVTQASAAYEQSATKIAGLNAAITEQQAAVDSMAEAHKRGEISTADYGAAVQKLWDLQGQLKTAQGEALTAQERLTAAQKAAGDNLAGEGGGSLSSKTRELMDAQKQGTAAAFGYADSLVRVGGAVGGAAGEIVIAGESYGELARAQQAAALAADAQAEATRKASAEITIGTFEANKNSIAWASVAAAQQQGADVSVQLGNGFATISKGSADATVAVSAHDAAVRAMAASLKTGVNTQQQASAAAVQSNSVIDKLRATYERTQKAYNESETALAKGTISQLDATRAKKAAQDALNAYNRALEQGVTNASDYAKATEETADAAIAAAQEDIRLAEAKGDVAGAQQKAISLAKLEAKWSENVRDAKIAQIEAERAELEAKKAQKEAIVVKTAADETEIQILGLKLIALGKATEAAKLEAAVKQQQAQGQTQATEATNENAQATVKNTEAQETNKKTVESAIVLYKGLLAALDGARNRMSELSDTAGAYFEAVLQGTLNQYGLMGAFQSSGAAMNAYLNALEGAAGDTGELAKFESAHAQASAAVGRLRQDMGTTVNMMDTFATAIELAEAKTRQAFYEQAADAERLRLAIEEMTESGIINTNKLAVATQSAGQDFKLLDEQDLSGLNAALEEANDRLREMQEETQAAQDRLAELNAEIAAERGDSATADRLKLQLEQQQAIAEVTAAIEAARNANNRELIALYEEQKKKLEELYTLREKNLEADIKARDTTASNNRTTTTSSNAGSAGNTTGRTYNLNLNANGRTLAATTVSDPSDFLAALERAQRTAA